MTTSKPVYIFYPTEFVAAVTTWAQGQTDLIEALQAGSPQLGMALSQQLTAIRVTIEALQPDDCQPPAASIRQKLQTGLELLNQFNHLYLAARGSNLSTAR
jgi:hypothetical protein